MATIKGYNVSNHLTHVWYYDEYGDFNEFEDIYLSSYNYQANCNGDDLPFIPDINWRPPSYCIIGNLVRVYYKDGDVSYDGIIDAYDQISRRHHIMYGDKSYDWLWASMDRVCLLPKDATISACLQKVVKQFERSRSGDEPIPPPWHPNLYGLDELFEIQSKKIYGLVNNYKNGPQIPQSWHKQICYKAHQQLLDSKINVCISKIYICFFYTK